MGQEVVKMLGDDNQLLYTGNLDTRGNEESIRLQLE
jgi:4-hydroxy-tetrahydrodipicolinate reductase